MFNITWIVGILLTIQVILNFDWCYQFTTSFLHLKCVILITMKLIISLFFNNQVRKLCIFYITRIVGILLTVWVILNFDWCYQLITSFFQLKWVIFIKVKCIIRLFDARIKIVTLYVQYHLNCRHITDNSGDIKLWLILSIHFINFAAKIGYFDHAEEYDKALWCKNRVSNVLCSITLELLAYYWQFGWY